MLCPTCPKRSTCKEACPELIKHLKNLEKEPFKALKSPQQIEKIEEKIADQTYYLDSSENPSYQLTEFGLIEVKKLEYALRLLSDPQRNCLFLYYWEGLSHSQ